MWKTKMIFLHFVKMKDFCVVEEHLENEEKFLDRKFPSILRFIYL